MVTAWADLGAARDWVPRCVSPFDGRVVAHATTLELVFGSVKIRLVASCLAGSFWCIQRVLALPVLPAHRVGRSYRFTGVAWGDAQPVLGRPFRRMAQSTMITSFLMCSGSTKLFALLR